MKDYLDFAITVNVVDGERYLLSVSGPGGEATGLLELPQQRPEYREQAERLRLLDTDEALLTSLGQVLFEAVFRGSIKDVYTRTQGLLGPNQGLRLRLVIPGDAASVASLPWEFLYDPDQGPLALLDAPVVRYLPQQDRQLIQAAPLPLKVLLTGAQTGAPAAVERELHEVQQALKLLGDRVEVTVEPHLTLPKLQQLLRSGFHIWHFAGHGAFARDGKTGQLILEDAGGDAAPVSAMQLGILLNRSGLKLVVLDACSSAELTVDSLRSVAPAIIRAQVPAVVAMQFKVPEESTRAFASEFYRALADGVPIDACVTEGRKAVMGVSGLGSPEWGIPVVYTRALDGQLFSTSATAALPNAAVNPAPATDLPKPATALPKSATGLPKPATGPCADIPLPNPPSTVMLRIVNLTQGKVAYAWIDDQGDQEPYGDIAPGAYVDQETFDGDQWVVLDSEGNTIYTIVAGNAPTQCERVEEAEAEAEEEPSSTVMLRITNLTRKKVVYAWINDDGDQEPYGDIAPGASVDQETFAGHEWAVLDSKGKIIRTIVAGSAPEQDEQIQ